MEGRGEEVKVERWENPMPSYITLFRMGMSRIRGKLNELYKTIWGKKEKSPEEIIPKDCWELVFQNLNSDDFRSCRAVCKSFKEIADLSRFKVKWKFDMVLPLLLPHLKTTSEGRVSWKNLSSIRMTCSSWRQSLDNYLSQVYKPAGNFPRCSATPLVTKFMDLDSVEAFLERFGECGTNPFPTRTVWIRNCEDFPWGQANDNDIDEDDEDAMDRRVDEIDEEQKIFQLKYVEKVGDLLEQFGRNIFKLRLNFAHEEYEYGCGAFLMCNFFKRITSHLPNIQVLHIDTTSGVSLDDDRKVDTFIQENQLSVLPKLETLFIGEMDVALEDYLLANYAPQLKTFAMTTNHYQFHMHRFEKLQKLSLEVDSSDTLEALQHLKSPLKVLKVKCLWGRVRWKVDNVFMNINHLPIEFLHIILYEWVDDGMSIVEAGIPVEEYLNESIKTLHISVARSGQGQTVQCYLSFNFLTSLKSLETLILVFIQVPTLPPAHQIIISGQNSHLDLFECVVDEDWPTKVSYSNLWPKMHNLKTLRVGRPLRRNEGNYVYTGYTWNR